MILSLLNFKRLLRRTITSDFFNGLYTCDGENLIQKDSNNFEKMQMFLLQEIDANGNDLHNKRLITFRKVGIDVINLETDYIEATLLRLDGNKLVFVNKGGEHYISFNS